MFRKDQIWFVHKDQDGVYVYSLADFTAQQGVRDTTDIKEGLRVSREMRKIDIYRERINEKIREIVREKET